MGDVEDRKPRYAIYFVPPADSALYLFGAAVIGYDCYRGMPVPLDAACARWPRRWDDVVREPRRYGFHATLKAPFRLASGYAEADLLAAMDHFAGATRDISSLKLQTSAIEAFVALVPDRPNEGVHRLAADVVAAFDVFRAPMSENEWARRKPDALTDAQRTYLRRWGYPYVLDEFRFHMTLAGPLGPTDRDEAMAMLTERFEHLHGEACMAVNSLSLLRQDAPHAPFKVIRQWPIAGR